jgi:hypothetical protein
VPKEYYKILECKTNFVYRRYQKPVGWERMIDSKKSGGPVTQRNFEDDTSTSSKISRYSLNAPFRLTLLQWDGKVG